MSAEEELYLVPQDGLKGRSRSLAAAKHALPAEWAADGKRIAFGDKDGKLYVLTLADRKLIEIADRREVRSRRHLGTTRHYLAFSMGISGNGFRPCTLECCDGKVNRLQMTFQCIQSGLGSAGQLSLLLKRP